jgi:hypothetical protein
MAPPPPESPFPDSTFDSEMTDAINKFNDGINEGLNEISKAFTICMTPGSFAGVLIACILGGILIGFLVTFCIMKRRGAQRVHNNNNNNIDGVQDNKAVRVVNNV